MLSAHAASVVQLFSMTEARTYAFMHKGSDTMQGVVDSPILLSMDL